MKEEKLEKIADNIFDLVRIWHILRSGHEDACSRPLPTDPNYMALRFLSKGDLSMSELGKRLYRSKPNMTPIIDRLIEEKKVERFEDESDRRMVMIRLTSEGKKFMAEKNIEIKNSIKKNLIKLSEEDLDKLCSSFGEVKRIISKLGDSHD